MKIHETLDPAPTLKLEGEVDHFNCPKAEQAIKRLYETGAGTLLIDLTDLTYMDTAGVAMIFWTAKKLYDRDGKLTLVIPPGNVRRILEMAGIGSLPATTVIDRIDDA